MRKISQILVYYKKKKIKHLFCGKIKSFSAASQVFSNLSLPALLCLVPFS